MRQLKKLQIKLKPVIPDHLAYLQDYWEIENNKWKYKYHDVVRKHPNIPKNVGENTQIVQKSSEVTYFDSCPKCGGKTYTFSNRSEVAKTIIPARDEYLEKFKSFSFDSIPLDESLEGLCGICQNQELFILSTRVRENFMISYSRESLVFLEKIEPHFLRNLEVKKVWPYSVITFREWVPWNADELEEKIKHPPIIKELFRSNIASLMKDKGNEQWGPVYTTVEIGNSIKEVIHPILSPPAPDPFFFGSKTTSGSTFNSSWLEKESQSFPLEESNISPETSCRGKVELTNSQVKPIIDISGNQRQFLRN